MLDIKNNSNCKGGLRGQGPSSLSNPKLSPMVLLLFSLG